MSTHLFFEKLSLDELGEALTPQRKAGPPEIPARPPFLRERAVELPTEGRQSYLTI